MRRAVRTGLRGLRVGAVASIVCFMFAPTAIMAVLSFSGESFVSFPPATWGLRQYREALLGDRWLTPLGRSLVVASAASIGAALVGALAVVALNRARVPARRLFQMVSLGPLLVPALAYAIALYIVFARLHLLGTRTGLMLAHGVLALPFVVLVVGAAIARVPRELEGAAMSLGAGRGRALLDVTARLLVPALVAALVLAFLTSFDEVVVTSFLAGIGYQTLPKAIFDDVRYGVDPAIAAVGMLLTVLNGLLLVAVYLLRRRAR